MATIFISYAQADRESARPLAEFLESSGYSVWWDAGLRPGDVFTIEIQRQINKAQHFIVIWSHVSTASFWVTAETTYARTCGKPILPLRIDDCSPPVPFNLLQTIDFRSVAANGPEVTEALVRSGTLPQIPGSDGDDAAPPIAASVVRKAQELARWEFIKNSNAAADFRTFLQRFPDGDLADLATMRLESLRWDEIVRAGRSVADLEGFLMEFPCGVKAPEAQRLLERKRRAREQADWSRLRPSLLGWDHRRPDRRFAEYEQFLLRHPDGVHAEQARQIVVRLKREIELWRPASRGNDLPAVERYLEECPYGSYASEAKAHRSRLRRQHRLSGAGGETGTMPRAKFPWATFLALALAAFTLGCFGGYLGVHVPALAALPFRSPSGEIVYVFHPYPILIGLFIGFLIHEWGNRSWSATLLAFSAVLLFRFASQLLGLPEADKFGYPLNSMFIGAMYCFGAWLAGFTVAPYMRHSILAFFVSILLGALAYPDWMLVFGWETPGHDVLTAGIFFAACTTPIAYSLLRATPRRAAPAIVQAAPQAELDRITTSA